MGEKVDTRTFISQRVRRSSMASPRVMDEERMVPDSEITPAQAEAKASGSDMFLKK